MSDIFQDPDSSVAVSPAKPAIKKAPMFRVVLLNDDYTPMEFVVGLLAEVFGHDKETAYGIMLTIHHAGRGICGVYGKEIAETLVVRVEHIAEESKYPLTCILELDSP